MGVTVSGISTCQECAMCRSALREKYVPRSVFDVVVVVLGALFLYYVSTVFVGQGAMWVRDGEELLGYTTLGIGWVVLGLMGIGAVVATMYYIVVNVVGMSVVYLWDNHNEFHVHTTHNDYTSRNLLSQMKVVVCGRIGGWFRGTTFVKGGFPGQRVETWGGTVMTVVDAHGRVTLPIYEAMRFVASGTLLCIAAMYHKELCAVAHEMAVLEVVSSHKQTPFGQSKHGVFLHDRAVSAMGRLREQIRQDVCYGVSVDASKIIEEARRREDRSA